MAVLGGAAVSYERGTPVWVDDVGSRAGSVAIQRSGSGFRFQVSGLGFRVRGLGVRVKDGG